VSITNVTDSTSSTTGALVVSGGIGVGKNLNIGQDIVTEGLTVNTSAVISELEVQSTTVSTSTTTGALVVNGGVGIGGNLNVGQNAVINKFNMYSDSDNNFLINGGTTTTGLSNTVYGFSANNNTGTNSNTAIGYSSLRDNSGYDNVAIGSLSLYNSGSGFQNVAIGSEAGFNNSGSNNVYVGYGAGDAANVGSNNICIGSTSMPSSASVSNECTIFTGNNTARFSSASGSWTFSSDMRDKTDIQNIEEGIDIINSLRPVKYCWDKREWYENNIPDGSKKENKIHGGFLAQELDNFQSYNNVEYLNLVYKSNPDKLEISMGNLMPIVIKALQDLSKENTKLKNEINFLSEELNKIKK
jgi:hypothetical protein